MSSKAPSIFIRQAYLAYRDTVLFNNLNLTLQGGKFTCLLGSSGVGKSTLLQMIAQLITKTATTQFQAEISCDNALQLSTQIAYMAQNDLLLPWLNALDNTLLYTRLTKGKPTQIQKDQAKQLLIQVGLKKSINKFPHELSGGMRQRVALARTLIQDQPIVLMDEPFSKLDALTRYEMQTLTVALLANRTVFFITHDPIEALRLADEIYILNGQPATLSSPLVLASPKPRPLNDPMVLSHQENLMKVLLSTTSNDQ